MRVIAGKARSLPLKTIEGLDTRPTTDRIKETLFNMLSPVLSGSRCLDLFAGSGAIGIEALSRGAAHCVFVDSSRKACACIEDNLRFTRLWEQGEVLREDASCALKKRSGGEQFDLVFFDAPYGRQLEREPLSLLLSERLLAEHGLIVVESDLQSDFSYVEQFGLTVEKKKIYKTNMHLFLRAY